MLTLFTDFFFRVDQSLGFVSPHSLKKQSQQQQSRGSGVPFEDEEDSTCEWLECFKSQFAPTCILKPTVITFSILIHVKKEQGHTGEHLPSVNKLSEWRDWYERQKVSKHQGSVSRSLCSMQNYRVKKHNWFVVTPLQQGYSKFGSFERSLIQFLSQKQSQCCTWKTKSKREHRGNVLYWAKTKQLIENASF